MILALLQLVPDQALAASLCLNGHPAPRRPHVTYGGLPTKPGVERDHCIPLGLGGADDAGNVRYQPLGEAKVKDADEHTAIENYCAGLWTLAQARGWLAERWPCK
jgi:hypothetical protein